jgi:hypothetical protein
MRADESNKTKRDEAGLDGNGSEARPFEFAPPMTRVEKTPDKNKTLEKRNS